MCTLWRIRYSCRRPDHEDFRVTCDSGLDCEVRKGEKRAAVQDFPETCMDENHIVIDPHLPPPRPYNSPT